MNFQLLNGIDVIGPYGDELLSREEHYPRRIKSERRRAMFSWYINLRLKEVFKEFQWRSIPIIGIFTVIIYRMVITMKAVTEINTNTNFWFLVNAIFTLLLVSSTVYSLAWNISKSPLHDFFRSKPLTKNEIKIFLGIHIFLEAVILIVVIWLPLELAFCNSILTFTLMLIIAGASFLATLFLIFSISEKTSYLSMPSHLALNKKKRVRLPFNGLLNKELLIMLRGKIFWISWMINLLFCGVVLIIPSNISHYISSFGSIAIAFLEISAVTEYYALTIYIMEKKFSWLNMTTPYPIKEWKKAKALATQLFVQATILLLYIPLFINFGYRAIFTFGFAFGWIHFALSQGIGLKRPPSLVIKLVNSFIGIILLMVWLILPVVGFLTAIFSVFYFYRALNSKTEVTLWND